MALCTVTEFLLAKTGRPTSENTPMESLMVMGKQSASMELLKLKRGSGKIKNSFLLKLSNYKTVNTSGKESMENVMDMELSHTLMGVNSKDNSFMAKERAWGHGQMPMALLPRESIKKASSFRLRL